MSLFDMFKSKPTLVKTSPTFTVDDFGNRPAGSFKNPNKVDAIKIETVFSAMKLRSESVGQLPLKMYRVNSDGIKEPVYSGREYRILTKQPNDFMTLQQFIEFGMWSYDRNGAFYAYKSRNDRGTIMELIPFRFQESVRPMRDVNGRVYYHYVTDDGKPVTTYSTDELFIVKGMTDDGITPISPLIWGGNILGLGLSQENAYRDSVENGITSNFAIRTPNVFSSNEAAQRLKDDWSSDEIRGVNGRRKVPVLENGSEIVNFKLTPAETELLSSRQYTVDRICTYVGVPREILGSGVNSSTKVTPSEVNEVFMMRYLSPIIIKFENEFNRLTNDSLSFRFDRKQFYSGSPSAMAKVVETEVKTGMCSINEGRIDLGRDPVKGGDVFVVQSNNLTFGTWDEIPQLAKERQAIKPTSQPEVEDNTDVE